MAIESLLRFLVRGNAREAKRLFSEVNNSIASTGKQAQKTANEGRAAWQRFGGAIIGFKDLLTGLIITFGGFQVVNAIRQGIRAVVDFEAELTKVRTLVGVNNELVGRFREQLLSIGPATGRGPAELARALFVVTSAGERSAAAIDIVEQSARASAIGLGDTAEVARAVTSAMQAFAAQGLTAQRAVEVLFLTVREGNLSAEELAGTLGRVQGTAAAMGITFEEVGAFVATFTRLGVDSSEAVTALNSVLSNLINLGRAQAAPVLTKLGESAESLQARLGKEGLISVLIDLNKRLELRELRQLIPNIRGLSGILGTAGVQGDALTEILEKLQVTTNILGSNFEITADTLRNRMDRIAASAKVTAIRIADLLAPSIERLLKGMEALTVGMRDFLANAGPITKAFVNLGIQVGVLAAGIAILTKVTRLLLLDFVLLITKLPQLTNALRGLAAASGLGVSFSILGSALRAIPFRGRARNVRELVRAFKGLGIQALITLGAIGLFGTALVGIAAAASVINFFRVLDNNMKKATGTFEALNNAVIFLRENTEGLSVLPGFAVFSTLLGLLNKLTEELNNTAQAARTLSDLTQTELTDAFAKFNLLIKTVREEGLKPGNEEFGKFERQLNRAIEEFKETKDLNAFVGTLVLVATALESARFVSTPLIDALGKLTEAGRQAVTEFNKVINPTATLTDKIEALKIAGASASEIALFLSGDLKKLADINKKLKRDTEPGIQTYIDLAAAFDIVGEKTKTLAEAQEELSKAINPSKELGETLTLLFEEAIGEKGSNAIELLVAFEKQIEKITPLERSLDPVLNAIITTLEKHNQALLDSVPALKNLNISWMDAGSTIKGVTPILSDTAIELKGLEDTVEKLGEKLEEVRSPSGEFQDVLDELAPRAVALRVEQLATAIQFLQNQGVPAEVIARRLGSAVEEVGEAARGTSISIPESVREVEKLKNEMDEASRSAKRLERAMATAFGNILSDLAAGIADVVFKAQGLGKTLLGIARETSEGFFEIFLVELFAPLEERFRVLARTVSGIFSGLASGIGSIFKSLFSGEFFKAIPGFLSSAVKGLGIGKSALAFGGPAALGLGVSKAAGGGALGAIAGGGAGALAGLSIFSGLSASAAGAGVGFGSAALTTLLAAAPFLAPLIALPFIAKAFAAPRGFGAGATDFGRDFGLNISKDFVKGFTEGTLGLSEEVFDSIRQDILTSPRFIESILPTLSDVQKTRLINEFREVSAFGRTFDLSEPLREAIESGDFEAFNEAWFEVFRNSERLVDVFGNQIPEALFATGALLDPLAQKTKDLNEALDELRKLPENLQVEFAGLIESMNILKDAGATDAEIMSILGEGFLAAAEAAKELGVEIPEVIVQLLGLLTPQEELLKQLEELRVAPGKAISGLADDISFLSSVGATTLEIFTLFKDRLLEVADFAERLGLELPASIQALFDFGVAIGEVTEKTEELTEAQKKQLELQEQIQRAFASGQRAGSIIRQGEELAQTIFGFGEQILLARDLLTAPLAEGGVLRTGRRAERDILAVQKQAFTTFKDQIISTAQALDQFGLEADKDFQLILDFVLANNLATRSQLEFKEAVEDTTKAVEKLTEAQLRRQELLELLSALRTGPADLAAEIEFLTAAGASVEELFIIFDSALGKIEENAKILNQELPDSVRNLIDFRDAMNDTADAIENVARATEKFDINRLVFDVLTGGIRGGLLVEGRPIDEVLEELLVGQRPIGFQRGGMALATRPTLVRFGEAGPELATFTPLNRRGRGEKQTPTIVFDFSGATIFGFEDFKRQIGSAVREIRSDGGLRDVFRSN